MEKNIKFRAGDRVRVNVGNYCWISYVTEEEPRHPGGVFLAHGCKEFNSSDRFIHSSYLTKLSRLEIALLELNIND